MRFTSFRKITAGAAAAVLTVFGVSLMAAAMPGPTQDGRNGQLHIVKNCTDTFSGSPGTSYCEIESSNLPELPVGARIYYNQITGGPAAGADGFLDSTIFVYVNDRHWAVGRCTLANDNQTPGLCTISDGVGPLAGLSARIVVTHTPAPNKLYLYAWEGRYNFDPTPGR